MEVDWAVLNPLLSREFGDADCDLLTRESHVQQLEALCSTVRNKEEEHQAKIAELRKEQQTKVIPILDKFEVKNKELIERLKETKEEEEGLRRNFDSLSQKTETAKKTVQASESLSLSRSQMRTERENLERLRERRTTTWAHLESIIALRNAAQNQMMNVGTISAELRYTTVERRDYDEVLEAAAGDVFAFTFGKEYQQSTLKLVDELVRDAQTLRQHEAKVSLLRSVQAELRTRIAHMVSLHWT